jgi:hypothetical protein
MHNLTAISSVTLQTQMRGAVAVPDIVFIHSGL